MSEWKTIESAPKDGTLVTVRLGKWLPYHARWKDGGWRSVEFNTPRAPTLWLSPSPIKDGSE